MDTTSASLLVRLREPTDRDAWTRFVKLYGPMMYRWARRTGLQDDDASDLVQDVMTILIRKLPEFEYDHSRSFRNWLKTVTMNRWRERGRRKQLPFEATTQSEISRVPAAEAEDFWESEYRQQVIRAALDLMRTEFQPATWEACKRYILQDESPDHLAAELGVSVWTIYSAKSRVVKRLRQDLDWLLD